MQVMIGNKTDCIDEIIEEISNLTLNSNEVLLLDYGFYQDILDSLKCDLSKQIIFLLDDTPLSEEFIKNTNVKKVFYPHDVKYQENLLLSCISLALIGVYADGRIGNNRGGCDLHARFVDNNVGLGTIMKADSLLIFLSGIKSASLAYDILSSEETPSFPASILMNHDNAVMLLDHNAASLLD